MDIRCSFCAEPVDVDFIHDVVAEQFEYEKAPWESIHPSEDTYSWENKRGYYTNQKIYETYFNAKIKDFRARGCVAIGFSETWCKEHSKLSNQQLSTVIYDIMGDDIDGVASAYEDAEDMGLI